MSERGAAGRVVLAVVAVLVIGAVVGYAIWRRGPEPQPLPAPTQSAPFAQTEPQIAPPEAPVAVDSVAEVNPEPSQEAADEPVGPVADASTPPKEPLNARTLAGSKWKPFMSPDANVKIEVEFAPDGNWKINGENKAKWMVEGKRVKIFDDKGEVHYVDIVGDKLMYNGEEIQRAG